MVVRLTVNQSLLARNHKIIPLNAELVHSFTQHNDFLNDYGMPPETLSQYKPEEPDDRTKPDVDRFDEEFVVGDIKQLHRYIISIDIWGDLNYAEDQGRFLIAMMKYAKKFNIPVNIPDEAKAFVNAVISRKKKHNSK
jgi:arylsulfatase A-like enzyme